MTDRRALRVTAPLILLVILLGGWVATTTAGQVPRQLLPNLPTVAGQLWSGLVTHADTWGFLGASLAEAVAGSVVGLVVALPLAIVVAHSRVVSAAVTPFLGASQAIPAIAIAPLLALWMASGFWRIVALCALMVFFPILVTTVLGFGHLDRDVIAAAEVDGARWWARLTYIEVPLALPSILAGVRNGFTLSVTGSVVGEMVMGGNGLGALLMIQRNAFDTAGMFATIIVLAVVAAVVYSLIALVERRWADRLTLAVER